MPKFTKTERQYIKGMVQNLSLQRLTDQDIVNYLHNEKKIEITRSMVTKIKNAVEEEAADWYLDLRESSYKSIAFYKERIDSLLSYQKRLNKIIEFYMQDGQILYSDTIIKAIAELHRIEMSVHSIFNEFPHAQYDIEQTKSDRELRECDCIPTHTITHSKCRACSQVWCPRTLKQDWCPNPDCWLGIKGTSSRPYDKHFEWIQCSTCKMWFKTPDVLAVHNCYIRANPKAIEGWDDEEPIVHQDQVMPKRTEPTIEIEPVVNSSPVEERIEEPVEEESEAERYWREHPVRRRVV